MINKVKIVVDNSKTDIDFNLLNNKLVINSTLLSSNNSFDIEFHCNFKIASFRNHDYTWVDLSHDRIATSFSPKIIKLENLNYIQANTNIGIWEVSKSNPYVLLWRFNPEFSSPITKYSNPNNSKIIESANSEYDFYQNLELLFSNKNALEISRSKIPFSAIACFTDHCDFDTLNNLKAQRLFFKELKIKISKGFFINHFSKRNDNASWQNDSEELAKWKDDGHELCYHSLSQSIKSDEESKDDFLNFNPPFETPTWIDHGYQPYNLSTYQKNEYSSDFFSDTICNKKITTFWNYLDSGTATTGVINQLNTSDFTLKSFYNGVKNKPFKKRVSLLIKNTIVHFYANETIIKKYASLASSFKIVTKTLNFKNLITFLKNLSSVSIPLIKTLFYWNSNKNKVYKCAKYSPVFFEHIIDNKNFIIFQTIELIDFICGIDKNNIDKLIQENGLFIAHTYFSVPMNYHDGRIFLENESINPKVKENFKYLSQKIEQNTIWNPTINEMVNQYKEFQKVIFDCDENGFIFIKNTTSILQRNVT